MRNAIYKIEIEYIIDKYSINQACSIELIQTIFTNSQASDRRKLYFLKEKISLVEIRNICEQLKIQSNIITKLIELFEVDDDLQIPIDLKDKIINNEPVAVFIGAGVSRLVGYPLWSELADKSIDFLLLKNYINHFESNKLKMEVRDPKQKLSIFEKFCYRNSDDWKEFYNKNLGQHNYERNIYDKIVSPVFDWIKLTSNIDLELRNAYERNKNTLIENPKIPLQTISPRNQPSLIISDSFSVENLEKEKLYYLHGSIENLSRIIFTTEDYIKNYYSEAGTLRIFLTEIFKRYSVVFIGYGLEEFPILEPILGQTKMKHYSLLGTYTSEMNLFNIKNKYFNSLNIELIPYYLDFEGYGRLERVLENWEQQVEAEKDAKGKYIENMNFIDMNI